MTRALLWTEWREQRWRCLLGTLVLTAISASLVRAQLVALPEAVLIIYGPLGLLLAVFLAMGSVATERADGTWSFLRAQPLATADILRAKWLLGAACLAFAFLVAACAAHLAAWSRGLYDLTPPPAYVWARTALPPLRWMLGNSAAAMWTVVGLSLTSMLAWYTVLFVILTRARDELHAGLGGILLTLASLAWLLQYPASRVDVGWGDATRVNLFWTSVLCNPLSPVVFVWESAESRAVAVGVALLVWTAGPLWLVGRLERAGRLS